jgi:hypothetical protein
VDFLVIGAMKSMTTSMLATLQQHPDVAVASHKEAQYFVSEVGWQRGPEWYASLFAHAAPGQLRGEASPQYTFFPFYDGVPQRIASLAPDVRLVYLVRDPVARAVSHWRHARANGAEERPLAMALLHDARYQLPSRYWLQLERYLPHVAEEQLLVVDVDKVQADPERGLREICAHLGADPLRAPTQLARLNVTELRGRPRPGLSFVRATPGRRRAEARLRRGPAPLVAAWDRLTTVPNPPVDLSPVDEERLRAVFAADARRLGQHLGADAPAWAQV